MNKGRTPFLIAFLAAPLLLFAVFMISPFVQTFWLALTDWTGYSPDYEMIGLENFRALLTAASPSDIRFWDGLRNNLILLIAVPAITLTLAMFFAALLNISGTTRAGQFRGVPGAGFYRVLFFLPQVISVTALAIMFQQMYQPNGLLNSLLRLAGLDPPSWLADPRTALLTVISVLVWMNVGFYLVHFTAAMASIPKEVLEAAALDNASRIQAFFRVTLPLLWPAVQTAIIYLMIMCLDVLAIVNVMTIGPGGPDNTTTVMALSLFDAKSEGFFGYASAQGVLIFVISMVIAAVLLRITRREQVEL